MSDRPTPITDALEKTYAGFTGKAYRAAISACYNVECELAEAREEIARLQKSLSNASAIYDAACEQRDMLAADITLVIECQEHYYGDATSLHIKMISVAKRLRAVLAAVKGGNP